MNQYEIVAHRQDDTIKILKEEMENLQSGFNPFQKATYKKSVSSEEITLIKALDSAYSNLSEASQSTKIITRKIKSL